MPYNKPEFNLSASVSEQVNSLPIPETSSLSMENIEQGNSVPPKLGSQDFEEVLARFKSPSVPDPKTVLNALKTNQQRTENVPISNQSSSTQHPLNSAPTTIPATTTLTNPLLHKKERFFYMLSEITDPDILSSIKLVGEGRDKRLVAMINGQEESIYKKSQKASHTLFLDGQEVTDIALYKKLWAIKCLAPKKHYHLIDGVGHYLLNENQHKHKLDTSLEESYRDLCKNGKRPLDAPSPILSRPSLGVGSVAMFAIKINNEDESEGNKKPRISCSKT